VRSSQHSYYHDTASPSVTSSTITTTTTACFGVRDNIKQGFKDILSHTRKKRSQHPQQQQSKSILPDYPLLEDDDDDDIENILPHHHSYEFPAQVETLFQLSNLNSNNNNMTETTASSTVAVLSPPATVTSSLPESQLQTQPQSKSAPTTLHLEPIQTIQSATITRVKAASRSRSAIYTLPRITRNLSQLEEEFRGMLEHFANYSEADLLSIADPRKRALFEGIAASAHSTPVYRAFEVLFEDLLPLRVAGRLIFTRLKAFMADSIAQREQDVQRAMNETGLYEDSVQMEEIRLMFVTTASLLNGDSYLTIEQLGKTGIISTTATEVLGFDTPQQLLQRLDSESQDGKLTFVELMIGLYHAAESLCGMEKCNPHAVMHNLLVELNEHPPTTPANDMNDKLDANRRKFSARYDEMVHAFVEWEHLLPPPPVDGTTEGRRMEVVRGCFVGAKNPKVVEALRIVYCDFAALRIAGDVIFKLVSSILNNRGSR
jgi:hypothetical protein